MDTERRKKYTNENGYAEAMRIDDDMGTWADSVGGALLARIGVWERSGSIGEDLLGLWDALEELSNASGREALS